MTGKTKIIEAIKSNDRFVVLGHLYPDGDSLGSMLALALYMREQLGKEVYLPSLKTWPKRYSFLEKYLDGSGNLPPKSIDCVIILDCSSENRVDWGPLNPEHYRKAFSIMIDHHTGGALYGNLNWVEPSASAVGEMIYDMLEELNAKITPGIAEALYLAILTDTGRFTFNNTTARALKICAELTAAGNISPSLITTQVYCNFSEEYLKNIGIALYDFRTFRHRTSGRDARIIFLTLDEASVRSFSTTLDETEGIVDIAMSMRGVEIAALFKEVGDGTIRVSLRSKGGVNVGVLAAELGGGGHHNAAGCTVQMPLEQAREMFLQRLETAMDRIEKNEKLGIAC